ncbi:hypothetical protein IAW_05833 [Bacillus cereus str. Schrouff]|uniref:hypothetical protein n=1 Tax=Bacillus cereus TaxID=1396 RepID=UPI000330E77F|nr:hypothetical protein [Bacillus cereus]EOO05014.1 hypothetical protein IAW_05833 [Bacillus cereus str. Schrouff]EOO81652.1 hypothetical protein IGY_05674 [Bacillus cereus K-5975c]
MKGICINADSSTELKLDQECYLFPAKPNHFYVSRFDNKGANFGCYQAERFRVIEEEEWPREPSKDVPLLNPDVFYNAELIWRQKGYKNKPLKRYVVQQKGTHCMFWHDEELKSPGGCFPLHWFAGFEELSEAHEKVKEKQGQELVPLLERPGG